MSSNNQTQYWVAFLAVDGVGRQTFFHVDSMLKKHELLWDEFWQNPSQILRILKKEKIFESIKKFKKEHTIYTYSEMLAEKHISVVTYKDEAYPDLLQEIHDFPAVLFVKNGPIPSMKLPIAFVGTRKMTSYGAQCVKKILTELQIDKPEIISGGMYGVDLAAHQQSLSLGMKSIAVLGYGFDHVYPRNYSRKFNALLQQGLVSISEFAPHVVPRPGNFPMRNRIVAGLSLGVVVVEAAAKSGSHITAQCALDEGRDVMAIPGPITSPYSEGTKWLCNQGAQLVSSGRDVLLALGLGSVHMDGLRDDKTKQGIKRVQVSTQEQAVIQELHLGPTLFDHLADRLTIDTAALGVMLSGLEMKGVVSVIGDEITLL